MAKNSRIKIKLISTSGSKHYYTTTKNKKTSSKKIELKKYDPTIQKHILYKEAKIK